MLQALSEGAGLQEAMRSHRMDYYRRSSSGQFVALNSVVGGLGGVNLV